MAILDCITEKARLSVRQRFEANVIPVTESGCWLWSAVCLDNDMSYGFMKIDNKRHLAHRISYELFNGVIPDGELVLHRCDVQSCVNPAHLFVGTQLDNVNDMMTKGRGVARRGELNGNSKLTQIDVDGIRSDYAACRSPLALSKKYGVSKSTIKNIVTGSHWRG